MLNIDLRTFTIIAGVMGIILGFILLRLRRTFPPTVKGLFLWGLAPFACAGASVFFALDSFLPKTLSILAGNSLLFLGCALFYFGSQRFFDVPARWRTWLGAWIVNCIPLFWFSEVQPDYRMRVFLVTTFLAVLCAAHMQLCFRRSQGFIANFIGSVLLIQVVTLLSRGLTTFWIDAADTPRFEPGFMHTIYIASFNFTELLLAVCVLLMSSEKVREEFERVATRDGLTGAFTRSAVLAAGEQALDRWLRYGRPLTLLLFDIDNFKRINDSVGHLGGDRVLIRFVKTIGQSLRPSDVLGRYGGEEFLVIMPETDQDEALKVAQRLLDAVAHQADDSDMPACTTSIGIASAREGDTTMENLLARADAALYRAKDLGKNRIEADRPAEIQSTGKPAYNVPFPRV